MSNEETKDNNQQAKQQPTGETTGEATSKTAADPSVKDEAKKVEEQVASMLQTLKESVREDDPKPSPTLTLRKILGGDILNAELVRRQLGVIVLVVFFTIVYVAIRYQCQQDMITIDDLENQLIDAKYKALSSSSALTERCRESHVLEILRTNQDSLLHIADQPPYIINVPK